MKKIIFLMTSVFIAWGSYLFFPTILPLEVIFLDIGQGDSILVKADNKKMLIDAGPNKKVLYAMGDHFRYGDFYIDYGVVTHPHNDHFLGFIEIMKRYKIGKIFLTPAESNNYFYNLFLEKSKEHNVELVFVENFQKVNLSDEVLIEFLFPHENEEDLWRKNINNASIVAYLSFRDINVLFTGDVEHEVEEIFLKEKVNLSSKILKVGHHGSKTSSSQEFLDAVNPSWAIIQSGEGNTFNHPHFKTLWNLEKEGIRTLRNDIEGNIVFKFN